MSNCNITQGYTISCDSLSMGGINKIWFSTFSTDTIYTVDSTDTVTGITSGATYFLFEQPSEGSAYNEEIQKNLDNGTFFTQGTLEAIFHKNDAALRNQILLLAKNKLSAVILDQNGEYWLIGKVNGLNLSAGSRGFGKAYGDLNGAKLTFIAKEKLGAQSIAAGSTALTALGIV